jgi:flagellar biosynthetic protein FlhB
VSAGQPAGEEQDGGDKPYDPTPFRLEEARRQGQVARSHDLTAAAALAGFLAALVLAGPAAVERLGTAGAQLIARADRLGPDFAAAEAGAVGRLLADVAVALLPFAALPAAAALTAVIAQRAFLVTPGNLVPRLARISPVAIAKQKFGADGLFEFAKSTAKLVIVAAVLGIWLSAALPDMLQLLHLGAGQAAAGLAEALSGFLLAALAVTAAVAAVDLLWQRHAHLRRHRMSHRDLVEETRRNEGDPHLKSERRRRGLDIATNRMLAEVAKADVVVVNPSHVAVALKWSRAPGSAPVCVAKGADEIARRIREAAQAAGVPVHRDPPTARALHATVEIGQEVRPEHYRAVAAAIRFAEAMRARARGRGWR